MAVCDLGGRQDNTHTHLSNRIQGEIHCYSPRSVKNFIHRFYQFARHRKFDCRTRIPAEFGIPSKGN